MYVCVDVYLYKTHKPKQQQQRQECEHSIASSVVQPSKAQWEEALRRTLGPRYHPIASHTLQVSYTYLGAFESVPYTDARRLTYTNQSNAHIHNTGLPPRRLHARRPPAARVGHALRRRALRDRQPGPSMLFMSDE